MTGLDNFAGPAPPAQTHAATTRHRRCGCSRAAAARMATQDEHAQGRRSHVLDRPAEHPYLSSARFVPNGLRRPATTDEIEAVVPSNWATTDLDPASGGTVSTAAGQDQTQPQPSRKPR